MNHTNTDYLFQVIPTGGGRGPSATRGDDGSGFDDLLSDASTSVFDAVHATRRTEPAAPSRTHDDPPRDASESNSRSTDYDDDPPTAEYSGPDSSASTNYDPPSESTRAGDDADATRRDETDNHDDLSAAATADVAQAQSKPDQHTTQTNSKSSVEEAKTVAGNKSLAKNRTKGQVTPTGAGVDKTDATKTVNGAPTTTETAAAESSRTHPTEPDIAAIHGDQSPTAESKDGHRNGTKAGRAAESAKEPTAPGDGSRPNAAPQGAIEAAKSNELAPTADNFEAATKKSAKRKPTEPADDESGRGAKSSSGASDRNDAIAAAKNPSAPGAIAANLSSASDNAATPDKSNSAVKPIKGHAETSVGPLGRAMRAATELARGNQSGGGEATPQVDPTRFVGRVAKAFHTAQERGGVLQLRLSPPELGSLKLQLVVKDGVLSATLETENAHARRLLLDHLPALRDRLAEQNIRVDRFDVDVQQENGRGQSNPRGSNQNPYQQQPDQSAPRRGATTQSQPRETATRDPLTVATPRIGATEINLIV